MSRVAGLTVVLVLATTGSAHAQQREPDEAEIEIARSEFQRGMDAAQNDRWEEAHDAFTRAYLLTSSVRVLGNLAAAQQQTGRLVEAVESYQQFLSEATGDERAYVEEEITHVEARIPYVDLAVDGLEQGDRVTLDGEALASDGIGRPFRVNPGTHRIALVRSGNEVAAERFTCVEAETTVVTLRPSAAEALDGETPAPPEAFQPDEESSGSVLTSPWLWIVVGVVVIGGIVAAALLAQGSDPERQMGTFGMTGRWEI